MTYLTENMNFERTIERDGYTKRFKRYFGGFQWLYKSGDISLSIICHNGSYGSGSGLFEIMPSWKKPNRYDDVKGYCDFNEVALWVRRFKKQIKKQGDDKHGK